MALTVNKPENPADANALPESGAERLSAVMARAGSRQGALHTAAQRHYVSAQGVVVPEHHPDAAYLLVGEGGKIPQSLADELGIIGAAEDESDQSESAGQADASAPRTRAKRAE